MTFYEMMGCLCSIVVLCAGVGIGVMVGFGILGGIIGGILGYLIGWGIGFGIASLILLYWGYRDRNSGKSKK